MVSVFNANGKSVGIGGPPSTLKALFSECDWFKYTKNVPMRKYRGFWHSARAYDTEHVQQIVAKINPRYQTHLPLFSPVTGAAFKLTDATTLLGSIIKEILAQSICWDLTVKGVTHWLRQFSREPFELVSHSMLRVCLSTGETSSLAQSYRAWI